MSDHAVIGRPTEYRPTYAKIVRKLAKNGATQEEIASDLSVHRDTLWEWARQYPAFSDALKVGKDHAIERVHRSLYERAIAGEAAQQIFYMKARAGWSDRPESDKPTVIIQIGQAVVQLGELAGVVNAGEVVDATATDVVVEPVIRRIP